MGQTTIIFLDASGERSSVNLNNPDLDISNVETYTSEIATNAFADMRAALEAVTLMTIQSATVSAKNSAYANAAPADQNAQRERKLLIKYRDDVTGKTGSMSVPGVNLALVATPGTDVVSLAQPQVAALVAELEANYRSNIGNTITVYEARHVGRNS